MNSMDKPYQYLTSDCLDACELCPRKCGINRASGMPGVCGATDKLMVARAALHFWEEPPISGDKGSGAIFFSNCSLKCIFCQNRDISTEGFGLKITPERLVEIMLELQDQGAHNINLVTATHYAHVVVPAVKQAQSRGLHIPIVYNTSGYERPEIIRELGDIVDVWLPDHKYASQDLAGSLSRVRDYPLVAQQALIAMKESVDAHGGFLIDDDGMLQRGMIVRHLVLPGHVEDSCHVLQNVYNAVGDVPISIMNQYTPNNDMRKAGGNLSHALSDEEYEIVLDFADNLGFTQVFWQEGGTVDESFTPAFDTTGVLESAACQNEHAASSN